MSKINILDKSIYNRIAAGEVVEKPASVVKELVENSIDAGATNIIVDITYGGIDRIRVTDNGCGIEPEDMPKALMPHATSKIACIEDLDKIGTLGFRGEALCSIASVSKLSVISKTKEHEGHRYVVHGGEVVADEPFGCAEGTSIIMENLFYNVPARAKFLRKSKQEETEITNYISRLIMANPSVAIKYVADNKLIFQSAGTNLFDAIYAVYGKQIVDSLIEINQQYGDYHVYGYIGKPTFCKANRTYQTLIINGRYVINQTVSTSIYKAYENYLMKGNFPFYILNIDVPYDKIDVNVHPNKLDVKFEDSNKIFSMMYNIVSQTLFNAFDLKSVQQEDDIKENVVDYQSLNILKKDEGKSFEFNQTNESLKEVELGDSNVGDKLHEISKLITPNRPGESTLKADEYLSKLTTTMQTSVMPEQKQTNLNLNIDNYKIIGIAFNTYIIVQQNDYLLLIDQHAAHERLLYDKFKAEYSNAKDYTQPLLVPYILDVNYQESDFINSNIDVLKSLGFGIESFGENCFKVESVPLTLKTVNLQEFFNDVLSNISNKLILGKADALEDYLARSACRAAVKANDILTNIEINSLLQMLSKDNQVLLCPHGRPVVIKITDKEIEKWFKRIV